VRIERKTAIVLLCLKEVFHFHSSDETFRKLVRERRSTALGRMFASGKGVVSQFTEQDRIATHDRSLRVDRVRSQHSARARREKPHLFG
jgi:hypothetical protein